MVPDVPQVGTGTIYCCTYVTDSFRYQSIQVSGTKKVRQKKVNRRVSSTKI